MGLWEVSPAEPSIVVLNANIVFLLLGLYGWEYVQSLDIEYAVIRGRLSFRWPLVPYVVGRTFLLVFLIVLIVVTNPISGDILCQPSILLTSLSGNIALGCSSTIFMIRAWVIWKDSRLVRILLLLLSLGQCTMLVIDMASITAIDVSGICALYIKYPQVVAATPMYTTCYDLLVFILSVVGLSRQRSESPLKKRLVTQGILYFAVTVAVSIPTMVCALLNSPLWMIFCDSAIAISTIASCRAARSLISLDTSTPGQTWENNSTLTTHIVIQSSISPECMTPEGRHCVDEADKC